MRHIPMLTTDNDPSISLESNVNDYFITFSDGQQHARFTPAKHQIIVHDGASIKSFELSYTSSRILELLILKADIIVSREEIFSFAWPRRVVGQNSLNQAISNIRELFHDDDHRAIIQTFPRRGYRFNSAFLSVQGQKYFIEVGDSHLPHEPSPAAPEPGNVVEGGPNTTLSNASINYTLAVILTVLVVTLLWRFDWLLAEHAGLSLLEETTGQLTTFYTSESEEELIQIKSDLKELHTRFVNLVTQPETVIFNRMHSFYEITCIDRGTNVKFLTIHKKQLGVITDEHIKGCLE